MNLPVRASLPRNTLPPLALQYKFRSNPGHVFPVGFAGLGDDCIAYDESGTCVDWLPTGGGTVDPGAGDGTVSGGTCPGSPGCPGWVDPEFNIDAAGGTFGNTTTPPYIDANGNLVIVNSNGTGYTMISPSGQRSSYGNAPPSPSSGAISPSQASVYASLVASLASAGVRIAAATNLPPGATILPNGTIVGAGQSYTSAGINASLAKIFTNPTLIVAGLLGVLILVEAGKR